MTRPAMPPAPWMGPAAKEIIATGHWPTMSQFVNVGDCLLARVEHVEAIIARHAPSAPQLPAAEAGERAMGTTTGDMLMACVKERDKAEAERDAANARIVDLEREIVGKDSVIEHLRKELQEMADRNSDDRAQLARPPSVVPADWAERAYDEVMDRLPNYSPHEKRAVAGKIIRDHAPSVVAAVGSELVEDLKWMLSSRGDDAMFEEHDDKFLGRPESTSKRRYADILQRAIAALTPTPPNPAS